MGGGEDEEHANEDGELNQVQMSEGLLGENIDEEANVPGNSRR